VQAVLAVGEEYCSEEMQEMHPELHPPYLFTGENCRPTRLPELLLSETCKEYEGGKGAEWTTESKTERNETVSKRYQEISKDLIKLFKDN
jgi:hypothetical protein